jgi:hypothetical protein
MAAMAVRVTQARVEEALRAKRAPMVALQAKRAPVEALRAKRAPMEALQVKAWPVKVAPLVRVSPAWAEKQAPAASSRIPNYRS